MMIRLWIGSFISIWGSIVHSYSHRVVKFSRKEKTRHWGGVSVCAFEFFSFSLDLPKALAEVFALDKADAIRQRDRVLRKVRIALGDFEKNRFCVLKRSGKFRKES